MNVRKDVEVPEQASTLQHQKSTPGGKRKREKSDPSIILSFANPLATNVA